MSYAGSSYFSWHCRATELEALGQPQPSTQKYLWRYSPVQRARAHRRMDNSWCAHTQTINTTMPGRWDGGQFSKEFAWLLRGSSQQVPAGAHLNTQHRSLCTRFPGLRASAFRRLQVLEKQTDRSIALHLSTVEGATSLRFNS